MVDRRLWETLALGRRLTRLRWAQKEEGETGLEAEIAETERARVEQARAKDTARKRKFRVEASAELAELEERARQGQLPSSDAERLEELQYRRTKEATRSRLSHSSQGSRRIQTSQPKQALSKLSPSAADAQAGFSASSMTAPNALPSIQSDSSNLNASPAIDILGLPSSTAEQQRHVAQAVESPLSHASAYCTCTPAVSSSEDVELGSHVNASSSGTGRPHPGRHVQDAESVASPGKGTSDSNDAQACQSLKRPATALSKPSMASSSQNGTPNKQQKMERAKPSGLFTGLQSSPDADLAIVDGIAINGHGPPATKALPNAHDNVETERKNASQQESSHISHARQRIARLESELEQMQERLASILYEQSKKHQADMEQLEGRLSRSYQLQLEGIEARLKARYQEFRTRSLKESEAKLLATTGKANAPAANSTRSGTSEGIQEELPSQPAPRRLTVTAEGLVQELSTYKKHVLDHSELGRKLDPLVYDATHQLLVCTLCEQAVSPDHLENHVKLFELHKTQGSYSKEWVDMVLKLCDDNGLDPKNLQSFRWSTSPIQPIDGLPVHGNAYRCTICAHICLNASFMRNHLAKAHQLSLSKKWCTAVFCQQLSRKGPFARFFEVVDSADLSDITVSRGSGSYQSA
ncbi:hypothetical protein BCR37DRAFT_376093 [Protomyces lactucae-debilis]|uniref:Uncharacterized protein n=1 Tax=Protomyces lactucae-debilis TaxID=2754530 RepID=A0A1Y2FS51_PROLT|nr:uncharacterized protein BCR37DRAFT_376093 [Protomyces lactucae-debilis]ORY86840.1 hypothetical protein BCR37DRAFT_376093 [Protomyces lactucae-debilis]